MSEEAVHWKTQQWRDYVTAELAAARFAQSWQRMVLWQSLLHIEGLLAPAAEALADGFHYEVEDAIDHARTVALSMNSALMRSFSASEAQHKTGEQP